MQLGKSIVEIRKKNNLTQEDFAKKFNVTRQTVSNWENGKSYPDLLTLVKISDEFGYSLDSMLKENPTMTENMDKEMKIGKMTTKVYETKIIIAIIGSVTCLAMVIISLLKHNEIAWIWLIATIYNMSSFWLYTRIKKSGTENNVCECVQLSNEMYIVDMEKRKLPAFNLFEYGKIIENSNRDGLFTIKKPNGSNYVLYGLTKTFLGSLFGMKRTVLGYYASLEDVKKELDCISETSNRNIVYELKYAIKM